MSSIEASPSHEVRAENCLHCGQGIVYEFQDNDGNKFCCNGCKSVFHLLKDNGLQDYYQYRKDAPATPQLSREDNLNFKYIDSDSFNKDYISFEKNDEKSMQFYLEGVHCIACLWLIEKLPQLDHRITSSRLNLSTSTVKVAIQTDAKFSDVAQLLNKLGYRPYPIKDQNHQAEMIRKEDRSLMLKIGIAGAASMNVMIYQISIYGGADGVYAQWFNYINLGLTVPVFFYSALPFFQSAWRNIKSRSISIDLPIAIGIFMAFAIGILNTIVGHADNYFDSICVLVFLLLSSRYILRKAQHRSFNRLGLLNLIRAHSFLKIDSNGNETSVSELEIKQGDKIKVLINEVLPVDGYLESNEAQLNVAGLTGESAPILARRGEYIYAGSTVLSSEIILTVDKIGNQTRLGKIYDEIERGWSLKAPISNWADKISKYLVIGVLSIALIDFVYWFLAGDWHIGINRALALVIITCPCALGLATPLAFIRSLSLAAQKNIFVKNEAVIERLTHAQTFVFDKTGTLTSGQYQVVDFNYFNHDPKKILKIILTLEWNSKHPIAKSLKEFIALQLPSAERRPLENAFVEEIAAFGIRATIDQKNFTLSDKSIENNKKTLSLKEDGIEIAQIHLSDKLKADALSTVLQLRDRGLKIAMLSGDTEAQVAKIGKELQIESSDRFSKVSPEIKNECLARFENPVMVGDGANDALALSHSLVGISLQGSVEASLRASDIHISDSKLIKIIEILAISNETLKVVKRNLAFSLIYNFAGLSLALLGMITPLWGAVLMPISSLTVLFSTMVGTKKLRSLGRTL